MKNIALLSAFTFLAACSGGSSSPTPESDSNQDLEVNSVTISGVGLTSNINEQGEYSLTISGVDNILSVQENNTISALEISGVNNTLSIQENNTISALEISGVENDVEIKNNTTVSDFTVSGTGNTIFVPASSGITFSDTGVDNTLITTTANSIVGTWKYTYPASQCVETYEFNANGTVNVTSLDEVVVGTYTFEDRVITDDRHLLSITFTSDNGLPDCNGLSEDNTGLNITSYINFTSAVVEWFNESSGGSPFFTLSEYATAEYEIEAADNDESFIINGEQYEAKTYCFNMEVGDKVVFLSGSAFGACASAEVLNLKTNNTCRVWCE
jgi:hypothetical protein